ncbi:uncharacterized protein LOC113381745 [Ctenocephalides felis]|uniref:uncharacterized protein LOC113381745 n=1 Tax=Ctenocephalides felis TaxID=7515 RepID=UPI000E6E1365|nr:uncharacterized protein LOC113381745 [Ctenocephalides felis]
MAKYLARQGKMLTKIMHGTNKKKKFRFDVVPTVLPTPPSISKANKSQGSSKRRTFVLNKLFMKYITEIMAMGAIGSDILGHGIEISRVKINSDFNKVNVYWLAKGTEKDTEIENILKLNATQLRHELSQLRVMGEVPRIEFVKDKYYATIAEVDECLKQADFGPDYTPSIDYSNKLRSEFTLNMPLSQEIKNKLSLLENDTKEDAVCEVANSLPVMTSNVYGLDQAKIMEKVTKAVRQSNLAWEKSKSNIVFTNEGLAPQNMDYFQNAQNVIYEERKDKFAEFLRMRQIERNKAMRKEKHKAELEKEFIFDSIKSEECDDNDDDYDYVNEEDDDLEDIK